MAISKNGLTICALLVTLAVFETWDFIEFPCLVTPELNKEEQHLPHTRQRRTVLTGQWKYSIDVVVNVSDAQTFELIRSSLNATDLPARIDNQTEISDISITTVCSSNDSGFQCRCEEQFAWPYSTCVTYGVCERTWSSICKCINVVPPGNQSCQPISALLTQVEYDVEVELNVTDVATVDYLRSLLKNNSFSFALGPIVNVTNIDINTVCHLNGSNFQCRCEDQYVWSSMDCATYGACDEITNDTCSCINSIPSNGQYCQPKTAPPVVYTYLISVELNISDVGLINPLRTILSNISYPISINHMQISAVNISTVCSPRSSGYQCRCEDQYRWSCDQCFMYGSCDNITSNTCGCINAIPADGQHCQPVDQYNFTFCPVTTTTQSPTTSPVVYEYIITIELNTTDVTVIDRLRNISYPVSISNNIKVSGMNISTVCSLSSNGYQCRCEDQYRWSCDQCFLYGSCYNITSDTCGCINAIPADGQHCQRLTDVLICPSTTPPVVTSTTVATTSNTTAFLTPTPTAITDSTLTTHMNTTIAATAVTNSTSATTHVNTTTVTSGTVLTNSTPIATTNMTTTTAATPTVTNFNTTTVTPTTVVTNSTPVATTVMNTTTPVPITTTTVATTSNTTAITDSTPTAHMNTTTAATTVTNSTSATTHVNTTTVVTNSTPIATTNMTTTTAATLTVTNFNTTKVTPTTLVTNSTPVATTVMNTTTATKTVFKIEMSIRLDMDYTSELGNTSSTVYTNLTSKIDKVIVEQYKGIPGYRGGFVTEFSNGSIITKFVVQTTQVDFDKILVENQNFLKAINSSIARVIGAVSAFYQSSIPIMIPEPTYTGASLSLKCEPSENFIVGQNSSSRWTFNGREIKDGGRFIITTTNSMSMLEVKDVIPADSGPYSCTLSKNNLEFQQKGNVTESKIKEAPVVRLKSEFYVKCLTGKIQPLKCCVQRLYTISWFKGKDRLSSVPVPDEDNCIKHDYKLESCSGSGEDQVIFTCRVDNPSSYEMKSTMKIFKENFRCNDAQYGTGRVDDRTSIECDRGQTGKRLAECQETGEWKLVVDTCIVIVINQLLIESKTLVEEGVPVFVENLGDAVKEKRQDIANSTATISAIVDILNTVADVSTTVNETIMQNILDTVDVIIGEESRESWVILNANETSNSSSKLLGSLESLSSDLVGEFSVRTRRILLNRTKFVDSFMADLNSSIVLNITKNSMNNVFITTILLSTLHIVMPTRNSTFDVSPFNSTSNETASDNAINAAVLLVKINATVQNVLLSYDKLNSSLTMNPQCVFWNFTLFDNIGAWDDEGCKFVSDINNIVTCSCNHLTSFSILMAKDIPPSLREALDIITYVGVGISLASLVICLVIEGYVWKAITRNSTAFMRHVSIVNTALSLLIADICFIIGASIANELPLGPCSTATFFMHFFYLALFFWMLVSGLLLFYRTVMVFSYMSKSIMLAIGFCLGYGCPLIIAVITVAVTAPGNGYIRKSEACWLNWFETKALLAMVIPALTIVFINTLIVIVVLYKMLKRGVGDAAQSDEKHTLVIITRCLVILTPLFGLTWGLGVGTLVSSTNEAIHIAFAFFNSLQGFFILLFGVLLDSKTRSLLGRKSPRTSTGSNSTRSTGAGISSLSGNNFIGRLLGRRYVYHVSQATNPNSSGAPESFSNI